MTYSEKASKRLIEMFQELPAESQSAVLDKIKYHSILQAANEVSKTKTVYFGDIYADVVDRQKYFNVFEGFSTGLQYFDEATLGLRGGELIIIAGPSNFGKTMIGLNVVVSAAVTNNKKVLIISMEMQAVEIASRAYNITDNHEALMENLMIQTELAVNTKHIAAMIERLKPDILLVDHVQFLANQEQGSEYERITGAVAKLKRLAMDYGLPVIAISHVAKTRSGSQGQATASDLKGSSSIEQDCDIGFMINRLKDNINSEDIILTLFKHRTKSPELFHKNCLLKLKGVKLRDKGSYTIDGEVPLITPYKIKEVVWNT